MKIVIELEMGKDPSATGRRSLDALIECVNGMIGPLQEKNLLGRVAHFPQQILDQKGLEVGTWQVRPIRE